MFNLTRKEAIMMKYQANHVVKVCMLAISLFSVPAVAGPDWSVIQEARYLKQQASLTRSSAEQEVMPLDHGPRALSTPWMNEQHMREIIEQAKDHAMAGHHDEHAAHS